MGYVLERIADEQPDTRIHKRHRIRKVPLYRAAGEGVRLSCLS
jgi:hypothetical protein